MLPLRVLFSLWTWTVIALLALAGAAVQTILWLVLHRFDRNLRVPGRFLRLLGVAAAKLAPTWRFSVHGRYPARLGARTVVVSNHASNADCFLISHLPWEVKWLGKKSLLRVPVFGGLMRRAGDIPIERGNRASVEEAMQTCRDYINRGMAVLFCPEGTRSGNGALLPFKDGAFRLAIETEAAVLPVAVAGTHAALPKHAWLFGHARALVKVGEPISTTGMTLADVPRLKAAARAQIENLLEVIRPLASAPPLVSESARHGADGVECGALPVSQRPPSAP